MKYVVDVNGKRHEIGLTGNTISLGGEDQQVSLTTLAGSPVCVLQIGESVHRIIVNRSGQRGRYQLSIEGQSYDVEALDERTRHIRDLTGAARGSSGPVPLKAPMPGLIVRILAAVGDQVSAGQG